MKNKRKIGIALEGGGAKGAYQIGVLKALNELNIEYDSVAGTSIGALNAVAYVLNEYEKYSYMWSKMDFFNGSSENSKKVFSLNELVNNLELYENEYLNSEGIDPSGIIKMLKENIDENAIRNSNINYGITTYCISDKQPLSLFKKDIPTGLLPEFIFASSNLPVFTPTPINGKYYLDGSAFSRLPINMIVNNDCDVVITVRLRPESYDFSPYRNIKIIDIAPSEFLSDTLHADQERIVWMMKNGYEDALSILEKNLSIVK